MSALRSRMQPCDTAPGMRSGGWCRGCRRSRRLASRSASLSARWSRGRSARRTRSVARQPVADDELAARCGRVRRADADGHAQHRAPVAWERQPAAREVDGQPCADRAVGAERGARYPARRAVGQRGQPDADPQPARRRRRASGRTMLVVASGVRARSVADGAGGARAAGHGRRRRAAPRPRSSRRRWRSSATGRADRERRLRGGRESSARPRRDGDRAARRRRARRESRLEATSAATARHRRGRAGAPAATAAGGRLAHPVNFGLRRLRVRTTKCVSATIASVLASSAARRTRRRRAMIPARRRIHAAWRASTEWIASAGTR